MALDTPLDFPREFRVVHFGHFAIWQVFNPIPVLVFRIVAFRPVHDGDRGEFLIFGVVLFHND